CGQPAGTAALIERGVDRMAGHERLVAADDLIIEADADGSQQRRARPDFELIVVPGRTPVVAVRLDHRKLHALVFHGAITVASVAEPVRAANLEPYEVVRVIHDAHAVGLGIAHADVRAADTHGRGVGHARGVLGAPDAAARSARVARSGSWFPKMALPATRMVAPAATTVAAVASSMPPSISMGAAEPAASN